YRTAVALQEQLVAEYPAVPEYANDLGGTYGNLGNLCADTDKPEASLDWYAKAIARLTPIIGSVPRLFTARRSLRNAHWGRAELFGKLDRPADAVPDWDRALALDDGSARRALRLGRATDLARAGRPAEAAAEAEAVAAEAGLEGE